MFRRMLDEAFEEFKQTVAPERPVISFPPPMTTVHPLIEPHKAAAMMPRAEYEESRPPPKPVVHRGRAPVSLRAGLRTQLSSPAQVRSAFRLMEILGPPVSLRDPLDRVQDR